jgi:hypothetical protein
VPNTSEYLTYVRTHVLFVLKVLPRLQAKTFHSNANVAKRQRFWCFSLFDRALTWRPSAVPGVHAPIRLAPLIGVGSIVSHV